MQMNGKTVLGLDGLTVTAMLAERGVMNPEHVVVELNGKIVMAPEFDTVVVTDNDTVEVISFVGGG